MSSEYKYIIVGAGISGLTIANELLQAGVSRDSILVLEANDYIGGLIKTDFIDGYITEWGPEGLRGNSVNTTRIFDMIDEEGIPVSEESKLRYIGKGDDLVKVPTGPLSAIFTGLLPLSGKLRILKEPFIDKKEEDETIAQFVERRLGPHVVPLVDAFVTGVYGGDPHQLSISHAFPTLKDIEREYGNLIPGGIKYSRHKKKQLKEEGEEPVQKSKEKPPFLLSTEGGMQGIVEGLAKHVNVQLGIRVEKVSLGDRFQLETSDGSFIADNLILATGVNTLQQIELTAAGETISPPRVDEAQVMVVTLGFDNDAFGDEVRGYGFLIPDSEDRFLMGTLFSSRLFDFRAPEDKIMLRCFVGGYRHPDRLDLPKEEIVENILSDLDDYLGVLKEPVFQNFQTHSPRGIPQLLLDHDRVVNWRKELEDQYQNLKFAGIGWAAIACDALINEARDVASALIEQ